MRNIAVYLGRNAVVGSSLVFGSVTLLQAFLKERGVSDTGIGLLGTVQFILQAGVMTAFLGYVDRVKKPVKTGSYLIVGQALLPLAAGIVSLWPGIGAGGTLAVILIAAAFSNIALGARALTDAKAYPYLFGRAEYGSVMGIDGVVTGVISVCASVASIWLLSYYDRTRGLAIVFLAGAAMLAAAAGLNSLLRLRDYKPGQGNNASFFRSIKELAAMKKFNRLAAANIGRGIAVGAAYLVMPVGIFRLGLGISHAGLIVAAETASSIICSLLFTAAVAKVSTEKIIAAGCVIGAAGFAALVLAGSPEAFIAAAFMTYFGRHIVDRGVPLSVYETIPGESVGLYSAGRLIIMTVSTAASTSIIGALIGKAGLIAVFAVLAAVQLITGAMYYIYIRRFKLEDAAKADENAACL